MKLLKMMRLSALTAVRTSKIDVEGSVIALMERMENSLELKRKKYAPYQLREILYALEHKEEKIRVVSYNLRFDRKDYLLEPTHHWPKRLPRVLRLLQYLNFDVLGVQEPYLNQIEDLLGPLKVSYHFFSKSSTQGEINGVFYRKDRFESVFSTVWSMTTGFRMLDTLSLVELKDRRTGKTTAFFNTHLSYPNIEKREQQVLFINQKLEKWSQKMPVVLMGDFNSFPNRGDLDALPFHDGDYIHRLLTKGHLRDARTSSLLGHMGPMGTYTNHGVNPAPFKGYGIPGLFLDHMYVSPHIKVLLHAVEPAKVNGHFPSDHMPIVADILVQ